MKKCQWCGAELIKPFGPKAYYVLGAAFKVDGLRPKEPICPACARQFKCKTLCTRIETGNQQDTQ